MTTKDFVVAFFMIVGVVLVFLPAVNVAHNYKDITFWMFGLFLFLVGFIIDRFWRPS